MTEIAGSLWNSNNWHWEEKDYSKWGREELTSIVESIKYTFELASSRFELSLSNTSVKGEASISVRKKQPILAYEFSISGTWSINETESKEKILLGQITIPEFSVDNYEEDFPVNITCKEVINSGYSQEPILSEIKKKFVVQLRKRLMDFHSKLLNKENDQRKIENEKVKRQEEMRTAEIARIEKEEEKRQIYTLQIEKEAMIKQETEASSKATADPQPHAQGSVWNANNWHWEEKPETNWVIETLTKMIEELSTNKPYSGSSDPVPVNFSNVKVTGEASSSVRKSKKICVLDCNVSGSFNVVIGEGVFSSDSEMNNLAGSFSLSEINMMDTHDYGRKVSFHPTESGTKVPNTPEFNDFKKKLEKQILRDLDNVIQKFCLEFLNK